MKGAIFDCPAFWERWLPAGIGRPRGVPELAGKRWDVLALTPDACRKLPEQEISCTVALVPGDCGAETLSRIRAGRAVSYGLSSRDSLTFSSLREPVLCIQRELPRPDGGIVEPQEIPLRRLPGPADRLLPLLGLWLLASRSGMLPAI